MLARSAAEPALQYRPAAQSSRYLGQQLVRHGLDSHLRPSTLPQVKRGMADTVIEKNNFIPGMPVSQCQLNTTGGHTHSRNTRGITPEALCAFSGKCITTDISAN